MIGDCCVCLFIKIPDEIKNLKTYTQNIESLVKNLKTGNYCFTVSYYPKDKEKEFKSWLGKDIGYMPQIGKDFCSRLKNSFLQAFSRGYKFVVIVNSEISEITKDIAEEALCDLEECDAVIGKTESGNIYLIGLKNSTFSPDIFVNVDWNSSESYSQLLETLQKIDYLVKELPTPEKSKNFAEV